METRDVTRPSDDHHDMETAMNIFERIGVSPVINAAGAVTRL
jgi:hypothetical protein